MPTKIPKTIWIILVFGLLLNAVAVVIAIRNPDGYSYPQATTAPLPQINYDKLDSFIAQQIAQLPKAQNGTNGQQGLSGIAGIQGTTGSQGIQGSSGVVGSQGVSGPAGPQGVQGNPGPAGKSIEIRYNTEKSQIEWRYEGDFTWTTLVSACTLTNTCP